MFIRYFLELPFRFDEVEGALVHAPEEWVPGLARGAEDRGELLLAEVGFGDGRRVRKRVAIQLSPPLRVASKTILPMTWRATGPEALFPLLEADLEVAALGSYRTQLSISARYRPPFGLLGRAIDRALLHLVAEAVVKDFLDRVGEVVLERASSHAPAGTRVRPVEGAAS